MTSSPIVVAPSADVVPKMFSSVDMEKAYVKVGSCNAREVVAAQRPATTDRRIEDLPIILSIGTSRATDRVTIRMSSLSYREFIAKVNGNCTMLYKAE